MKVSCSMLSDSKDALLSVISPAVLKRCCEHICSTSNPKPQICLFCSSHCQFCSLGLWESRKFNTSSCKQWPKHYRQTNIIPNVCDQFPYYSLLYNSCYTKWGTCSLKFLKQIFSTVDSITAFKRKSAVCWGSASSLFIPRFLGACPWLMDKGTHKIK